MKKLLKLNPEYLIGPGFIVACIGVILLEPESSIGLWITFLGSSFAILGCVIGFIQSRFHSKNEKMKKIIKTVIGILIVIGASLLMWLVRNDN
mgnify:FL=1